ncbi:MAG: dihydrofolate reductase [Ruminococcaceae bacterium]|nr:dihydrofolate reductase [Oscillospiraceae bacterium]
MDLIVAVYSDWGIGCDGTQPVALSADRVFFRETTRGATVIAGRKTVADFPGQKPLPGRKNIVLTRQEIDVPGFTVCHSPEEALKETGADERVFIIGGGSIYRQMLPYCERAYVTKLSACPRSDTYFPDLDEMPDWEIEKILSEGEENGIAYQMCLYRKKR